MSEEDYGDDDFHLWVENVEAFALFCRVRTQWRVGPGGAVGLDYNVLLSLMDRMSLDDATFDALFDDVQVMERGALAAIAKRNDAR